MIKFFVDLFLSVGFGIALIWFFDAPTWAGVMTGWIYLWTHRGEEW